MKILALISLFIFSTAICFANSDNFQKSVSDNELAETKFKQYMNKVNDKLMRSWLPPRDLQERPLVFFKIHKDGSISDLKIFTSAGSAGDEAAIDAVKNAAPFEPLPNNCQRDIEISFTFGYRWTTEELKKGVLFRKF